MRVYLGGAQGVGKTSIAKLFVDRNPKYSRCSGSELLMSICGVATRKELENIDKRTHEYAESVGYVNHVRNFENLIVDGHFELNELQVNCFKFFVYITCPATLVVNRIEKDETRKRNSDYAYIENDLKRHLQRIEDFKKRYSRAPLYVFNNKGSIEKTVEKLEKLVNQYSLRCEDRV